MPASGPPAVQLDSGKLSGQGADASPAAPAHVPSMVVSPVKSHVAALTVGSSAATALTGTESSSSASSRSPIPPNATAILSQCFSLQRQLRSEAAEREAQYLAECEAQKRRLALLRHQQQRREALYRVDAEALVRTAVMLDELGAAVREREVPLKPDGYQAFLFPNEDVYEGSWKNCRMHGKGCLRRAEARDLYEGQWFLGQRCGPGTLRSADFETLYCGAWLDNKRHGRGELIEPEGVYAGEFIDNRISGFGEYVYRDGHIYRGDWRDGFYHGNGTYLCPSGSKYDGSWHNGYEHGRGTRTYPNGDVYTGEWHEGLPHGHGTYTSAGYSPHASATTTTTTSGGGGGGSCAPVVARGFRYEGQWAFGSMHGTGTCTFGDGTTYRGSWQSGQPHGMGLAHYPSPCPYPPRRQDGVRLPRSATPVTGPAGAVPGESASGGGGGGRGTAPPASEQWTVTYSGEFHHGRREGYGEYEGPFAQYAGLWHDDGKAGYGAFKARGGGGYECVWRADVPSGRVRYTAEGGPVKAPPAERLARGAVTAAAAAAGTVVAASGGDEEMTPGPSSRPQDGAAGLVDPAHGGRTARAAHGGSESVYQKPLAITANGCVEESTPDTYDDVSEGDDHVYVVQCDERGTCISVGPQARPPRARDETGANLDLRLKENGQ